MAEDNHIALPPNGDLKYAEGTLSGMFGAVHNKIRLEAGTSLRRSVFPCRTARYLTRPPGVITCA